MNEQVQAIRSEIERMIALNKTKNGFPAGYMCGVRIEVLDKLLSFIDSLPEESSRKGSIDKADLLRWLREMYNRAERLQADIHIEIAAKAAVVATLKNVIEYIEQR